MKLRDLPGLGAASEQRLIAAGIATIDDLRKLGAVDAYRQVQATQARVSLNLLWALEGALTNQDWRKVARTERDRLLLALDARADSVG